MVWDCHLSVPANNSLSTFRCVFSPCSPHVGLWFAVELDYFTLVGACDFVKQFAVIHNYFVPLLMPTLRTSPSTVKLKSTVMPAGSPTLPTAVSWCFPMPPSSSISATSRKSVASSLWEITLKSSICLKLTFDHVAIMFSPYALKLDPQPHVLFTLGLSNLNPLASSVSR